eukprot:symbB.v1.2.016218.t1/scaffold1231.1/size130510/11
MRSSRFGTALVAARVCHPRSWRSLEGFVPRRYARTTRTSNRCQGSVSTCDAMGKRMYAVGFKALAAAFCISLNGCEGGCDHAAATLCQLDTGDCTDLARFGGCIKDAKCCDSSDQSTELSGMTSWRKRLNELFEESAAAGNQWTPMSAATWDVWLHPDWMVWDENQVWRRSRKPMRPASSWKQVKRNVLPSRWLFDYSLWLRFSIVM